MLNVKIKKLHEDAVIPTYAKDGDAGLDIVATSKYYDEYGCVCYGTQLAFEIPEGHVGLLFPRSSNAKKDLTLTNSVGVLDSGYRGEVMFKFKPSLVYKETETDDERWIMETHQPVTEQEENWHYSKVIDTYEVGERIGQIVILPYPKINFVEVEDLSTTERGGGGFGSTGTGIIPKQQTPFEVLCDKVLHVSDKHTLDMFINNTYDWFTNPDVIPTVEGVGESFYWGMTEQGHDFWSNINNLVNDLED